MPFNKITGIHITETAQMKKKVIWSKTCSNKKLPPPSPPPPPLLARPAGLPLMALHTDYMSHYMIHTELQIRGVIQDNSKIFFLISQWKQMLWLLIRTVSMQNRLNETVLIMGHNIFLWKNMDIYPKIIPVTPSYLELWWIHSLWICLQSVLWSLKWL